MPMTRLQVEKLVADNLAGSEVEATDLTGTEDHWHLLVIWPGFEGKPLIQQHRLVMDILQPHMQAAGGPIHAVQLKTVAKL